MTGTHGGRRRGSGRRKGAVSKRSRAIADKAAAKGLTGVDVQLEVMELYRTRLDKLIRKLLALKAIPVAKAEDKAKPAPKKPAKQNKKMPDHEAEDPDDEDITDPAGEPEDAFTRTVRLVRRVVGVAELLRVAGRDVSPYTNARINPMDGGRQADELPSVEERFAEYAREDAIDKAPNVHRLKRAKG